MLKFLLPITIVIIGLLPTRAQVLDDTKVIAFLPFENNINDNSDNSLDFSVGSGTASYTTGVYGKALSASNLQLISDDDSVFSAHQDFTLAVWVRLSSLPSVNNLNQVIMHQTDVGPDPGRTHAEVLRDGDYPSSFAADDRISGTEAIEKNLWFHFAVTNDVSSDKRYLYVNGILLDSGDAVSEVNYGKITIAANKVGNLPLDGRLDDFLLTSQVLSQEEIISIITHGVQEELDPNTDPSVFQNPIVTDTRDIDVSYVKGKYWMIQPYGTWSGGGYYVLRHSDDMVNWTETNSIFQAPANRQYWQGYLFETSDTGDIYLYYTRNQDSVTNVRSVGVAKADTDSVNGSYTDLGLLVTGKQAIDPYLFKDIDGTLWLYYKDGRDNQKGLWVQKMSDPETKDGSYTAKEIIHPQSGTWEDNGYLTAEGPCVKRYGDKYYIFYTGGPFGQYTYATGYAYSNNADGTFTKYSGNPILSNNESKDVFSPGVPTIVEDGLGDSWMYYRQRITAERKSSRFVAVDPVDRSDELSNVIDVLGTRGEFQDVPYAPGTEFYIENKQTGLRIRPETSSDGADMIVVSGTTTSDWVRWTIVPHNNGSFYLRNVETGHYFRPSGNTDGDYLEQKDTTYDGNRTRWHKIHSDDGYFYLRNEWTDKYFRPVSNAVNSKIEIRPDTWDGDWTRWKFIPATSGGARSSIELDRQIPEIEFEVYPNPFKHDSQLVLSIPSRAEIVMEFLSLDGRILKRQQMELDAGKHTLAWNGDNQEGLALAKGVYICKLQLYADGEVHTITRRIIKQ
ncbi:family 43 glycosylhydrolase [Marinoscillum sp.]|uniref:family 43 glycosylhydrolase n=1 Tax=Marinoscillum sp. TaxID=2024838 RepID=UPI003BABCBA0